MTCVMKLLEMPVAVGGKMIFDLLCLNQVQEC